MTKDKFLLLLTKKLSGDISTEESELIKQAIKRDENYKQLADKLTKYFKQNKTKNSKVDQLRSTWTKIAKAENESFEGTFDYNPAQTSKFNTVGLLKIAAVLALVITSALIAFQFSQKHTKPELDTFVASHQKSFRQLEDGTQVWLNKNSSISYNKAFGKAKREITLQGEAYFDVVKNSAVPLFIHVGDFDIEVKGTAFNVNAYSGKPSVQVALVRGSILVTNRLDTNAKVLLKPNQKLIIPNTFAKGKSSHFLVVPIQASSLLSETKWISDTLIFHKEKLKDLAIQLEKKYELKIEIRSALLKEKRFSGTFTNETIQQVLDALKLSYPLTYTISNKLVIIKD